MKFWACWSCHLRILNSSSTCAASFSSIRESCLETHSCWIEYSCTISDLSLNQYDLRWWCCNEYSTRTFSNSTFIAWDCDCLASWIDSSSHWHISNILVWRIYQLLDLNCCFHCLDWRIFFDSISVDSTSNLAESSWISWSWSWWTIWVNNCLHSFTRFLEFSKPSMHTSTSCRTSCVWCDHLIMLNKNSNMSFELSLILIYCLHWNLDCCCYSSSSILSLSSHWNSAHSSF